MTSQRELSPEHVRIISALREQEDWRLSQLVPVRESLPHSALEREMVPLGAPWSPFGRLQAFALTFNGYQYCRQPSELLKAAS